MNWISIMALLVSIIGVGIAYLAYKEAKKVNKAVMRQNWEKELAETEQELANVNFEISKITSQPRKIYGVVHPMDMEPQKMRALGEKRALLLKRKAEIENKLKQL